MEVANMDEADVHAGSEGPLKDFQSCCIEYMDFVEKGLNALEGQGTGNAELLEKLLQMWNQDFRSNLQSWDRCDRQSRAEILVFLAGVIDVCTRIALDGKPGFEHANNISRELLFHMCEETPQDFSAYKHIRHACIASYKDCLKQLKKFEDDFEDLNQLKKLGSEFDDFKRKSSPAKYTKLVTTALALEDDMKRWWCVLRHVKGFDEHHFTKECGRSGKASVNCYFSMQILRESLEAHANMEDAAPKYWQLWLSMLQLIACYLSDMVEGIWKNPDVCPPVAGTEIITLYKRVWSTHARSMLKIEADLGVDFTTLPPLYNRVPHLLKTYKRDEAAYPSVAAELDDMLQKLKGISSVVLSQGRLTRFNHMLDKDSSDIEIQHPSTTTEGQQKPDQPTLQVEISLKAAVLLSGFYYLLRQCIAESEAVAARTKKDFPSLCTQYMDHAMPWLEGQVQQGTVTSEVVKRIVAVWGREKPRLQCWLEWSSLRKAELLVFTADVIAIFTQTLTLHGGAFVGDANTVNLLDCICKEAPLDFQHTFPGRRGFSLKASTACFKAAHDLLQIIQSHSNIETVRSLSISFWLCTLQVIASNLSDLLQGLRRHPQASPPFAVTDVTPLIIRFHEAREKCMPKLKARFDKEFDSLNMALDAVQHLWNRNPTEPRMALQLEALHKELRRSSRIVLSQGNGEKFVAMLDKVLTVMDRVHQRTTSGSRQSGQQPSFQDREIEKDGELKMCLRTAVLVDSSRWLIQWCTAEQEAAPAGQVQG